VIKLLNILSEQTNPNQDKLIGAIKVILNDTISKLKKETEEMGLGEMEYINEIESVKSIDVDDFHQINNDPVHDDGKKLYVTINVDQPIYSFGYYENTRTEIRNDINKIIPYTDVYFKLRDTREFGPGIDW